MQCFILLFRSTATCKNAESIFLQVAAEVALRRSRVPKNKRPLNEMAAGEEVAAEDERQRKDMIQKRAAGVRRAFAFLFVHAFSFF